MYTSPGQYIDLGYSTWNRSNAGYEWRTIPSDDSSSIQLVEKPETTNYIVYEPLDIPTLFLQFVELDPTDAASILEFADKYGPLVISSRFSPAIQFPPGETLEFWQEQLIDMINLVNLWHWHKANDLTMLNKVIWWGPSGNIASNESQTQTVWYAFNDEEPQTITDHPDLLAEFKPGDIRFPALRLIADIVMEKLRDWPVRPFLFTTPQEELVQRFVPMTLLSAMWFQIFQAVSGEKLFKQCAVCHKWEDVTDKKATWTRHPECAGRERVKKYREKNPSIKQTRT